MEENNIIAQTEKKVETIILNIKDLINKHALVSGFTALIIIAGIIVIIVWLSRQEKREQEASIHVNKIISALAQAKNSQNALTREQTVAGISSELAAAVSNYSGLKNSLRAQFALAGVKYESAAFKEAGDLYLALFNKNKKYYLAPLSLLYAACCLEEAGEYSSAIAKLLLFRKYYERHYIYPEALFALARNYKLDNKFTDARREYSQIEKKFPNSSWSQKAREELDLMALGGK